MRYVLLTIGFVLLAGVTAVGLGQPPGPSTAPPATFPAPVAASPAETPLAKFEPLAVFPATTQVSVRSVLLGAGWLTRMNQSQGRFIAGYRPALRQPVDGDNPLHQARAALALAQAAKFSGDDRQTAVASQAVLALLAVTKADPADPTCRVPVVSSFTCNRVGFAAVLALCVYDLPAADENLLAEAEKLCEFVRRQLRADGSVHYTDGRDDVPTRIDPAGVNEYPGAALYALAVSNGVKPAAWKAEAVTKGLAHYSTWFKANPLPALAASLTPAFAELYLQSKSADAAAAVFEMNDWLLGLQYPAGDPRHPTWAGGFRGWASGRPVEAEPGAECGAYLQSLAGAYHLTRLVPDAERAGRYRPAVLEAAQFVTGLQYGEANTRHFENSFRANVLVGGVFNTPTDGNLRVEATAGAVSGLLRFLSSGAERN